QALGPCWYQVGQQRVAQVVRDVVQLDTLPAKHLFLPTNRRPVDLQPAQQRMFQAQTAVVDYPADTLERSQVIAASQPDADMVAVAGAGRTRLPAQEDTAHLAPVQRALAEACLEDDLAPVRAQHLAEQLIPG